MNNIFRTLVVLACFSAAAALAFADQPSSSLDDKPSVDTAAVTSGVSVPAVPSDTSAQASAPTSYLYDLKKLIDRSRANIKEVNEKIKEQAVLKRNQKREERAREYYEKGVELTSEGKLDEAREYFEKAIRITEHPEMAGYIKESQRRLRKQESALEAQEREHYHQIKADENVRKEDVESAYREAVDLYKQKKYHPAKDAFEHVDEIAPDYRATSSYLKIIDQDIILADAEAVKKQAVEIERQQKEAEAARAKEKAMWLAQIEEKEKEHKEAIDKQAENVYDEAIVLYKKKQFAEAKKRFEEVSWVIPDYKRTMWYLGRIDRDAQAEEKRVALEQQKALQQQRWDEEVQKKKQEAARQEELKVKEAQHLKDLEDQAEFLYSAAVNLYNSAQMDLALAKFNDIENTCPGYKSTRLYIARIDQWLLDHHRPLPVVAAPVQIQAAGGAVPDEATLEQRRAQELKSQTDQARTIYIQALQSYRDHQWAEALSEFDTVEKIIPDYKHTRWYLHKLDVIMASNPQLAAQAASMPSVAPRESSLPPQVKVAVSLEDQQKQAEEIAALVEKSELLYRQIADIADDRPTRETERGIGQVNRILNRLKLSKDRLLNLMRQQQWKQQQEALKVNQDIHMAQADKLYQAGLDDLRTHDFKDARISFMQLDNIIPDYKATRHYLSLIDKDQNEASAEAITNYEKYQSDHLKELQDKENAQQADRLRKEQQEAQQMQQQQQSQLMNLAQKAADINDSIISLARQQDYDGMKKKFTELENTVTALLTIKNQMIKEKDRQEREKQMAKESARHEKEMLRDRRLEDRQIHAYASSGAVIQDHPGLSSQPFDADEYKHREISQEQNVLFSEAVDRYEHRKYTQAKLLFGELADQNDRRAEVWLKKVDRAITQELFRSQVGEEKERTAFIAEQLKAQRQLLIIQERERQRQKKLTEEMERQKRLYEDDRSLQLRKEEAMKVQEHERELQERKRNQLEKANEKEQEKYRFHKVETIVSNPVPATQVPAPKPVVVPQAVVPAGIDANKIKTQEDLSNERKAYLEKQFKKEQEEKERLAKIKADEDARQAKVKAIEDARQARIKSVEDARQKRIQDREKEREHKKELKLQREQERQARIKAAADAKAERERLEAENLAQEKIKREEAQRQEELENQERQRQAQLEAQREAVRKQLEEGVEAMYEEALSLYNQGQFTAAADRFKDVQEILPDYKRTGQYLIEARQRSINENAQAIPTAPVEAPVTAAEVPVTVVQTVASPAPAQIAQPAADVTPAADNTQASAQSSTPVSHQDSVSKALDLFDPNVK